MIILIKGVILGIVTYLELSNRFLEVKLTNLPSIVKAEDSELKRFALSIDDSYTYEIKHYVNYLNQNNMKFNFESFKTYIEIMKYEGVPVRTINKRINGIKKKIKNLTYA